MEALVGQQLGPAACRSGGSRRPSASMRFSRWVKAVSSFPFFPLSCFFFFALSQYSANGQLLPRVMDVG